MAFNPENSALALLDCSGNPNYPADSLPGHEYTVSVAGKIGGSSGKPVNVGDKILCLTANVGGTEASVGSSWVVYANAYTLTATRTVLANENGATFYLDSATEFVTTLPAPALGLRYTFIVRTAPSGASYTVVTTSSANIIKGWHISTAGDQGDTGTADDTITFVDGQAVASDRVDVESDGTSWFAYARSKVTAGITFTQAS